jgi:hypothetical protein
MKSCNQQKYDHMDVDTHIKNIMDGNSFAHDEFVQAKLQRQTTLFDQIDVYYFNKLKINEPSVISAEIFDT